MSEVTLAPSVEAVIEQEVSMFRICPCVECHEKAMRRVAIAQAQEGAKKCMEIGREQMKHACHDWWNGPDTAEACADEILASVGLKP